MAGELPQPLIVHNAIAASVTLGNSVAQPLAGVRKATIMMTTAGNWSNAVSVSADGTNWVTYNKLISNATNAIAEGLIRTAALACNNTTSMATMDLTNDCFAYVKIVPTKTSGGTLTTTLLVEYY